MGLITRATRFQVLNAAGFRCHYCGRSAPEVVLEVDHVHPVSAGGHSRRSNLVAACFDCNRGKLGKPLAIPDYRPRRTPAPVSLKTCGDCCPWCELGIVTLPVAINTVPGGYVMAYRCSAGHDWETWIDGLTAHVHAADTITEQVPCWPQ